MAGPYNTELLITLNRSSQPLAQSIVRQLRADILAGKLKTNDRIPASRKLAKELGVSRGTVLTAVEILIAEGLLVSKPGSGTYVCADIQGSTQPMQSQAAALPKSHLNLVPQVALASPRPINFQVCRPSLEVFPSDTWRKAMNYAATRPRQSDYGEPKGEIELRTEIAEYLRRARSINVSPEQIIVTNGAVHAVALIARLFLNYNDCFAIEDPGYPLARQSLSLFGARACLCPVDQDGLLVDKLEGLRKPCKLVYVTPAHQFPTGSRLALPRRKQLLHWARNNHALVLEDDYDGEFRYDVPPLPPLASLSALGQVIYLGTFSKTLFPALRIGYAVADQRIIDSMTDYRTVMDYQTNSLTQLALAEFIRNGEFEKHIHRMRRIYAKKRLLLKACIQRNQIPGELIGIDSGINGVIQLEKPYPAEAIARAAVNAGIDIKAAGHYSQAKRNDHNALVLGYGALSHRAIEQGIKALAAVFQQYRT